LTPDLDLTRDALASSTLSHGLHLLGDRWTVAVILGAFLGVRRFDEWQTRLNIPRHTLNLRLKALSDLGLLQTRPYQQRPLRNAYHLTDKGLALYSHVLMMWVWERRWGARQLALPPRLVHQTCGHAFVPELTCTACGDKVGVGDLTFSLRVNADLLSAMASASLPGAHAMPALRQRGSRLSKPAGDKRGGPEQAGAAPVTGQIGQVGLDLRADRWVLLIVSAVLLGCHHFDQLSHVLGIGSSVLARRLSSMVDSGLLLSQADVGDARRKVYRLTPASRDLFGYIMCFSSWASRHHFNQPSSIMPMHKACGKHFVPQVVCGHCRLPVLAREVVFTQDKMPMRRE
jgi:DNA-binding HxlR family transcriptional regulator